MCDGVRLQTSSLVIDVVHGRVAVLVSCASRLVTDFVNYVVIPIEFRHDLADHGFLALDVQRQPPDHLRIEVEVANFYPAIAAGFSMPVYTATQALVHVLVTHAFLRSLATLELEPSRVGRLAGETAWPD